MDEFRVALDDVAATTETKEFSHSLSVYTMMFTGRYHHHVRRSFFTNAHVVQRSDPYRLLGLEWGATTAEIKQAFRSKAQSLHPDVNPSQQAHEEFLQLRSSYESLMRVHSTGTGDSDSTDWQFSLWSNGDRLARDRTDVAGVRRKRPQPPAQRSFSEYQLGQQANKYTARAEFLGNKSSKVSSSVGRGINKWVTPKADYQEWKPKS